jgi:hypothetical protein
MATVEATMHAVHQLRNNPPPSGASPSAVEQWRHDIDQLIIVAINTPPLEGGGSSVTSRALVHTHTTSSAMGTVCLVCNAPTVCSAPTVGSAATIGGTSTISCTRAIWTVGTGYEHSNGQPL